MTKKPIISVIIPTYNRRELLGEALRSATSQTGPWRLDIVVIDDGSTDDSEQVVRKFWGVRYMWRPREGTAAARNHGVRIARGGWLAFLDPDDLWAEDKLQRQMTAAGGQEAVYGLVQDFLGSSATDPVGHVFRRPEHRHRAEHPEAGLQSAQGKSHRLAKIVAPALSAPVADRRMGCLLIRRRSFLRVGWFDTHRPINSEVDWVLRSRSTGLREVLLPHVVLHRRLRPGASLDAHRPPYLRSRHDAAFNHRSTA